MKFKKLSIFITLLIGSMLCSCTFSDVALLINPSLTPPAIELDPIPDIAKVFSVPNSGRGIDKVELFDSYSDFDDYGYVALNIESNADVNKKGLLAVHENFERNNVHLDNDYTGLYKGYNIINILSESLEIRFAHPNLTPTLWKLMESSMYFENFYADEHQEGATCNSEFMSLSGLLPVTQADWGSNMCSTATKKHFYKFSLPAQLKANDYDTFYFHSGFSDFYNREAFMEKYGYAPYGQGDDVRFLDDLGIDDYISDEEAAIFFEEFIDYEKYQDGTKNFSVNFLTYSLHGGYSANSLAVSENVDDVTRLLDVPDSYFNGHKQVLYYLAKLRSYDAFLEQLVDTLEKNNVTDNTLITIYRDHHPYIMDSKDYTWYLNKVLPEGFEESSIDRFKHPLLIIEAGNLTKEKKIIKNAGATVDIVPTFLNLLGVEANYRYFHGVDILSGNSLAFLHSQKLSDNLPLVTDGQGTIFEIANPNFDGDADLGLFYMKYLLKKIMQESNMVDIVHMQYFSYYYYYIPVGTWVNEEQDITIEIDYDGVYLNNELVDEYTYTVDYQLIFQDSENFFNLKFNAELGTIIGTLTHNNSIRNFELSLIEN